jgi:subtilisin family serine protease
MHQFGAGSHQFGAVSPATLTRTGSSAPGTEFASLFLVRFRSDVTTSEREELARHIGGWIYGEIPQLGVTRIAIAGRDELTAGETSPVEILTRHPSVEFAEIDGTVRLAFEPNDQYYLTHPASSDGQWGIRKALVDKAWDTVRGAPSVTVAVMDTGVDPTHPDLIGALVPGNTFITQPDDECTAGTTRDDNSHGTHVAGIIGASGNNTEGIAGVAFGVRLMPVKVLDCTGQGNLSDVANGLVWAVDNGAKVVNLSLGSTSDSPTLRSAISYAAQRNVLVVSASGNCGTTGDKCLSLNQLEYPAAYPEVLAVAATDTDDSIAFFSTRNASVDVSAPGRRIVSTTPTYATYLSQRATNPASLRYSVFSGTSQAAPFAAGVAALIWSAEPSLTAAQVVERIRTTTDDFGAVGYDESYGTGRVNAQKAIAKSGETYGVTYDASALPTAAKAASAFTGRVTVTNTSSFTWRAANPSAVRLEWGWLDAAGQGVAGLGGVMPLPADMPVGASATLTGSIAAPAVPAATVGPTPFTLRLDLVRDGVTAFSEKGVTALAVPVAVGSGFGATYAPVAQAATFDSGTTGALEVRVTNSGTVAWPAAGSNPMRLSYHWLKDGAVVVWDGLRGVLPADVAPGATVTLSLSVLPPEQAGTYTLRLDLVHEGIAWLSGLGVAPTDIAASVRSAYVAMYTTGTLPVLLPGGRTVLPVSVTNTGTVPWNSTGSAPMRIATHVHDAAGNVVIWDGIRTLLAQDLAAGAKLDTQVTVDAPLAAGSYKVRVDVVREGIAWLSGLGVATGDATLLVAADYRAELPTGALTVSRSAPTVSVAVKNLGLATWTVSTLAPLNLSAHWFDSAGNTLVWDGPRTPLAQVVAPGATVTVPVALGTPPEGAAFVQIDLVSEGVRWFGAGLQRPVTLAP